VEFVFTTPEQLASSGFREQLADATVDLVVIDEAHCISQWGHDFRPAYLEAVGAIRTFGAPTVLALTATATPDVIDDITRQLGVGALRIINTGVHRPNLSYAVRPVIDDTDKQRQVLAIARQLTGAGIIYAATVRHVESLAQLCRQEGVPAVSYHGRMRAAERAQAQDAFMSGATPLILATNAFGMGIDKPDIRAVVHYDLPASLDVYYQESGRAGRDGHAAACTLLFQRSDRGLQSFFMAGRYPTLNDFTTLVEGLRTAGDADVSLEDIRNAAPAINAGKLRVLMMVLKQEGLVRERRGSRYAIAPRLLSEPLDPLASGYEERRQRDRTKLEQMVIYAQTALCRTRVLLDALGEEVEWTECGTCDNCLGSAVRAQAAAEGAA